MRFEWDEIKNRENIQKHKVPFEEAASIFLNEIIEEPDLEHSDEEDRYKAVGISVCLRELLVVYCIRVKIDDEKVIRIISARKANANERRRYYER
jgi:uncharacterized DUF497 family protein